MISDEQHGVERFDDKIQQGMVLQSIINIQADIKEIKEELKTGYIRKVEFAPVRNIVFGMMAVFALSILGAVLKLVVMK